MLPRTVDNQRILIGERFSVSFQRTLRIPDDGRTYPLPPGLGAFPIHKVRDYLGRVPAQWQQNGVFIPMYQREALWLGFDGVDWKPCAVKIGIGKVNAISGEPWDEGIQAESQNYIVCPNQPWLDGINAGEGLIRQFVAMPLGLGYTVEAQVTGVEEFGGIQIVVYEPLPGKFLDSPPPEPSIQAELLNVPMASLGEMGLGGGGTMKQKIYPDPYGIDTWDLENYGTVFIYIVNTEEYKQLTNLDPPSTPISATTYTHYGLPWFDLYDEKQSDIPASQLLANLKTIHEQEQEKGISIQEESVNVDPSQIHKLHLKQDQ